MDIKGMIAQYDHQLEVTEFIRASGVNMKQLYIDRFWESIADDKWIYVGNEILAWLGYTSIDPYKCKERYVTLLRAYFVKDGDFKQLTASEMKVYETLQNSAESNSVGYLVLPGDFNSHNKTKHLLVSPDCFKESLMMLETSRAKEIRKHYVALEKVFKAYIRYCNEFTKRQLEKAKQGSAVFKEMVVQRQQFTLKQYVYIATSRNYAKQNIFKVGTTTNPKTRIAGYQTGRCEDDRFGYVYIMPCHNGKSMESFIFSFLDGFRYGDDRRELFHIHLDLLMRFMKVFEQLSMDTHKVFNQALAKYYDSYHELEPASVDHLFVHDMAGHLEEEYGIISEDDGGYIPPIEYDLEPYPLSLTTEQVNEALRPYGMMLVGEYTGRCEQHQTFRCLSVLNHEFRTSWDSLNSRKERGCPHCRKHCILDDVLIYVYEDRTYKHLTTYKNFDELKQKEPDINHQLLKNIIREERWLTSHEGRIYSILSPHDDGLLSLMKPLTDVEQAIIKALEIDYELMKKHTLRSKMNYIIAIHEEENKAYFDTSATQFSNLLTAVGRDQKVNRKTIPKYLNSVKRYAGFKWITSSSNICSPYKMVDLQSLARSQ